MAKRKGRVITVKVRLPKKYFKKGKKKRGRKHRKH